MPGRGEPSASEITPEALYLRRREFIKNTGLGIATAAGVGGALLGLLGDSARPRIDAAPGAPAPKPLAPIRRSVETDARVDPRTPFADITTYNNYYELGLDKSDPAENAGTLKLRPWTIRVSGEVKEELTLDIDTLLGWFPLEERIYRMRCVEAWSMVIPWLGFPLAALVKRLEPTSRAKYLAFTTLLDPEQLPGQRRSVLDWPYVEGLRIDEATHPLAILAVGLYGKTLLGQNGAPIRLVVPWKYGFKGIKSIVKLELTERQPVSTWNAAAPSEYGFYANVNPEVDHPRWSQRTERRIGEIERRITLPFNGYGPEVASLYAGLDLRRNFSVTAAAQSGVRTPTRYAWLKPGVLAGALIPLALLIVEAANRTLGADPVAIALNRLGLLALIMLLASLSATPARLALGWSWPLRLRRMLGLLAFFYASLHVVVYVAVDQGFAWSAITKDITERKFIGMGFAAFVVLVPLAVTSPVRVRRWMGPLRWQRLHRLVYVAGLFAATHFIWRVKRDLSQPLVYAAVLALLLLVRLRKRAPRS